jgi:hypothetical protein
MRNLNTNGISGQLVPAMAVCRAALLSRPSRSSDQPKSHRCPATQQTREVKLDCNV